MKKYLLALLMVLGMCGSAWGADYYVDGATGNDDNDGTIGDPWQTINKANSILVAGDTVYLRGGEYNVLTMGGINPTNSGHATNGMITYSGYEDENIVLKGEDKTFSVGILLNNKSFIKVEKITVDTVSRWYYITNGGDYNEITDCTFSNQVVFNDQGGYYYWGGWIEFDSYYNHIHNNIFTKNVAEALNWTDDGAGAVDIGNFVYNINQNKSSFNVIEDNYIYHTTHHGLSSNSPYNVIRNNVYHNEPWRVLNLTGTNITESQTIVTIDITTLPAYSPSDWRTQSLIRYNVRAGLSITNTTSGATGTISAVTADTITAALTGGTRQNWAIGDEFEIDMLWSYRGWQINAQHLDENDGSLWSGRNLFEGNKLTYAARNPNVKNVGGTMFELGQSYNIIRHNDFSGAGLTGINFNIYRVCYANPCLSTSNKHYGEANGNRIYNNTFVRNGYGDDIFETETSCRRSAINFYCTDNPSSLVSLTYVNDNHIKNNLFYQNYGNRTISFHWRSDIRDAQMASTELAGNWEVTGVDPLFVNNNVTTGTNGNPPNNWVPIAPETLRSEYFPDLRLQAGSPCINAGVHLTTTTNSGSHSTTLTVDCAGYFQDGKFGHASLPTRSGKTGWPASVNIQADWIAIGTTINTVQIDSINYDTNTITLATSKTWADEDKVWLYKKSDGTQVLYGVAPDTGAHEYVIDDPDECTTDPEDDCVSGVCNEAVSPTICVPCLDDDTGCSSPTPACKNGGTLQATCVECDAGDATECTEGTAVCDLDTNTCVECNVTADCTAEVCNTATHVCVECTLDTHCGDAETCSLTGATANTCVSTCGNGIVDTGRNEVCDTAHTLGVYPGCESDEYCPDGCLSACVEKPQCATNANCTPPKYCQDAGELTAVCVNKCGDGILDNVDNATTGQQALGEECEIGIPCSGEEAGNYCGIDCQCIAIAADTLCSSDIDCNEGSRCINRNCTDQYECLTNNQCTGTAEMCLSGFCERIECLDHPDTNATTGANPYCDWRIWQGIITSDKIRCINSICTSACYLYSHCSAGEVCWDGNCVDEDGIVDCYGDEECGVGFLCVSNNCIELVCRNAYDCDDGKTCKNNECVTATDCDWDDDCLAGQVCQDGACTTTGKRQYIIVPGITTSN